MLNEQEIKDIFSEVALAPSAHNTQPAVWKINNSKVELEFDMKRELPIADPKNHDLYLSLGASIEGLKISLRKYGYALDKIESDQQTHFKAEIIKTDPAEMELYQFLDKRYCHRDPFVKANADDVNNLNNYIESTKHLFVTDKAILEELMKDYDVAAYSFLKQDNYFDELCQWLRLSSKSKYYYKDGLNLDSMGLNFIEKLGARVVMRPGVFKVLKMLGLGKVATDEYSKNMTATGVLLVLSNSDSLFEQGAEFYRTWLKITEFNMAGCPLSSLADHKDLRDKWIQKLDISKELKLVNILKVGPYEDRRKPKRCRLDFSEIIRR